MTADKPRYSRVSDILDLAIFMSSKIQGVTVNEISERYNVSRRTAERMRDSLTCIFPSIDEIETDGTQKHWGFTNYSISNLITFTSKEIANIEQLQRRTTNKELKEELGKNVEKIKNNPNVKFLGTLTKEEYYKEFKKHKVWFLPCVVVEDFGICAAEAVMCGNHIVSPYLHGMQDVLSPFTPFGMTNKYNVKQSSDYHYSKYELEMSFNDFTNTNNEAAQSIIDIINNYDNPLLQKILMSQRKYVMETYTWNNIVDKWIKLFESK